MEPYGQLKLFQILQVADDSAKLSRPFTVPLRHDGAGRILMKSLKYEANYAWMRDCSVSTRHRQSGARRAIKVR